MLTVDTIPLNAQIALSLVQRVAPAVISGGYLRDLDHDVVPKDLDIFFSTNAGNVAQHTAMICWHLGVPQPDIDWVDAERYAEWNSFIVQVFNVEFCGIDVNLIGCSEFSPAVNLGLEIAQMNDFGLCQISFDGKDIVTTHNYEGDKLSRQFVMRCEELGVCNVDKSRARFARLSPRYPGYSLEIEEAVSLFNEVDFSLT